MNSASPMSGAVANFSTAQRHLTLHKDLFRNIRSHPLTRPLEGLSSCALLVLSVWKEYAELLLLDDKDNNEAAALEQRTEWLSTVLFLVLAKLEDLSATAAEWAFLDGAGGRREP